MIRLLLVTFIISVLISAQSVFASSFAKLHTQILNEKEADEIRFKAVFNIVEADKSKSIQVLRKLFTHRNWILRDAAIKNAARIKSIELIPEIEGRLTDKALVVRTTAVDALSYLEAKQSLPKLLECKKSALNFSNGKPLWIHSHLDLAIKKLSTL